VSELPDGWVITKLGEICEPSQYGYTTKASHSGNARFLRTTDITSGEIKWSTVPFCDVDDETLDKYILYDGDVVISRAGSVGFSILIRKPELAVFASYLIRFRPIINAQYFTYYLKTPSYWNAISEQSLGIAVQNVNASKLSELEIPLAPSNEQTRIVEKLEELLSDLDAGVAELKAAQKKLALYRQSLLKAAVEGALTAEWRAKRTPSPQPLPREGGGAYSWGEEGRRRLLNDPQDSSRSPCGEETEAWSRSQEAPLSPCGRGVGGEGAEGAERARNTATPQTLNHAKLLRRHQTPQEQALWQTLRAKRFDGYKFRRQQPMGPYIVDFVCFSHRLIIELDGGHHAETVDYDTQRDNWLREQGFQVLRFWNHDYTAQPEAVLEAIWQALQNKTPLPNPSPARGEGLQIETGAQLLERILIERRARWEAKQLAKFKEQGKTPPQDWQKKYPEPVQPDTTHLPELPEGWVWASLDMLGEIVSGIAKGTKRANNVPVREVAYLRVANVQRGYLDLTEVKSIVATEREITELTLKNGDILFNEGGDRDKLGRGWIWHNEVVNCIHQNHVFRMRTHVEEMQPELISHHGNTFGKLWFQNAGKQTTNLASINLSMLRAFPVPVAPPAEQLEILEQIRFQLDRLTEQERTIELALKQTAAQRQNLLRAAFSGQLVPQDPNDEPASVLLDRIRAERDVIKKAQLCKPKKSRKIS